MANEIEKQTLNFFVMGVREFLGAFSNSKDLNLGRLVIAIFLLSIAFLFVGVEALKVMFRRKFIRGEVNIVLLIIATLAFFGWGWLCFSLKEREGYLEMERILIFAGRFNFAIGILVLVRGVLEWNKSNDRKNTGTILGESILLGFLKNSWWNEYRIKMFAEPLTVFAVALPLTAINFYLGIPLVFCGISQAIFNVILSIKQVEETIESPSDRNEVQKRNTVQ